MFVLICFLCGKCRARNVLMIIIIDAHQIGDMWSWPSWLMGKIINFWWSNIGWDSNVNVHFYGRSRYVLNNWQIICNKLTQHGCSIKFLYCYRIKNHTTQLKQLVYCTYFVSLSRLYIALFLLKPSFFFLLFALNRWVTHCIKPYQISKDFNRIRNEIWYNFYIQFDSVNDSQLIDI